MRKALVGIVALSAVISAAAVMWPRLHNAKPVAKPKGPVSAMGYVVDADGRLVAGVKVYAVAVRARGMSMRAAESQAEVRQTVVTDKDGKFEFRGLPSSRSQWKNFFLVAYVPNKSLGWVHCPVEYMDRNPMCPNPNIHYQLVMHKLGKQKGRVVDVSNKPVAGAKVSLAGVYERGPRNYISSLSKPFIELLMKPSKAVTDARGYYELSGVPLECSCLVSVAKRGMVLCGGKVVSSDRDAVMILRKKLSLCEGRVVDRHGKPVSGATVVVCSGFNCAETRWDTATTGPDGRYVAEYVGRYDFFAAKNGKYFMPQVDRNSNAGSGDQVKPGTRVKMFDLVEAKTAVVSGRVLDAVNGKPVSGVVVTTSGRGYVLDPWSQSVLSDASGCYQLRVPIGRVSLRFMSGNPWYKIYPKGAGKTYWGDWIDITKAGIKNYDLTLVKAETVKGTVVDSKGVAVKGALVSVGELSCNWTRSRADGSFELPVNGAYGCSLMPSYLNSANVLLRVRDYVNKRSCTLYVDPYRANKGVKAVVMPNAKVRVVVHDLDGKPVKGATVWFDQARPKRTDSSGYTLFSDFMNAPAYFPRITKPGYLQVSASELAAAAVKKVQPTLEPATVDKEGVRNVEATLANLRGVQKGKVVDMDGKPLVDVPVSAELDLYSVQLTRTVTDSHGEFVLKNLPGVPVRITAGAWYTGMNQAMSGPEYVVIKVGKPNYSRRWRASMGIFFE